MWHVWIWGSSQFGKLSLAIFTTRLPLARPHAWASTSSLWLWTTAWTADTLQEPKSKGSPTNPSWKTRISRDRQKEILLASKAMDSTYNQWPFLGFKFQRWMSSITFGNDENQISKGQRWRIPPTISHLWTWWEPNIKRWRIPPTISHLWTWWEPNIKRWRIPPTISHLWRLWTWWESNIQRWRIPPTISHLFESGIGFTCNQSPLEGCSVEIRHFWIKKIRLLWNWKIRLFWLTSILV